MGTVLVTSCSSRADKQWEGVPADLLSTGIARQGLLLGHCQGDSPQPKPSWHWEAGQKGGGMTLGTPFSTSCQCGICRQLMNPMPGAIHTPPKHPPSSAECPRSSYTNPAWHRVKPREHNSPPAWQSIPRAADNPADPQSLDTARQHSPSRRGHSAAAHARRG